MPEVTHTRGDTFEVVGRFIGVDFTGWVGASQVRDFKNDAVLSDLQFEWIDPVAGTFRAIVYDTHSWPHDAFVLHDVQATSPEGRIVSSIAQKIQVTRDATRTS